jgi:hypothetical protein
MPRDCVILVADLDTENALKGLLSRPGSLGCRRFDFELYRHPRRDPGVRLESASFLRAFSNSHSRAIAILDRHGSGADLMAAEQIEVELEAQLKTDWQTNAVAIVIDPELESWVWSDSPEVDQQLGWGGQSPTLGDWLLTQGLVHALNAKPKDPRTAFERALRQMRKPKSAFIFESLGKSVSTRRCSDRAFVKLRDTLALWFPRL